MTSFWKTVLSTVVAGAVLAGGAGLVLSKVTAAEVADLKDRVTSMDRAHQEDSRKVAAIESTVQSTKESVERIEDKLDRLLLEESDRRRTR